MSATRPATTAPTLPSIIDLALHAGAVTATYQRLYDVAGMRDRYADKGLGLGTDHEHKVHELIMTMRARNLADVAAQLFAAYVVVDGMEGGGMSEQEYQSDILKLRRVILGSLPVVAEAAGVELSALGGDYVAKFADNEFPPLREDAQL
jgi:hypothetical protein